MNAKWILMGTLLISCCVGACSDSDSGVQEQQWKIDELEARLEVMDSEIRDRDREFQKLESENEKLKTRPPRLSKQQIGEVRKRIAKLESIDEEIIPITDELEEFRAALHEIEAKFRKRMEEVTEGLEGMKEIFRGDSLHWDLMPELIQNLKDDLAASEEENEKLKKELAELRASER